MITDIILALRLQSSALARDSALTLKPFASLASRPHALALKLQSLTLILTLRFLSLALRLSLDLETLSPWPWLREQMPWPRRSSPWPWSWPWGPTPWPWDSRYCQVYPGIALRLYFLVLLLALKFHSLAFNPQALPWTLFWGLQSLLTSLDITNPLVQGNIWPHILSLSGSSCSILLFHPR